MYTIKYLYMNTYTNIYLKQSCILINIICKVQRKQTVKI